MSKALTEVTQIQELQGRWNEILKTLYVKAAHSLNLPTDSRSYFVRVGPQAVPESGALIKINLPTEIITKYEKWKFSDVDMATSPRTLTEFRSWWDQLHKGVTIVVPDISKKNDPCMESISRRNGEGEIEPLESYSVEDCSEGWGVGDISRKVYNADEPTLLLDESGDDTIWMSAKATRIKPTSAAERKMTREVTVTIWHSAQRITIKEEALQDIFPDWHSGSYAAAFPELAAVSKDLETIEIKGVAPRIESSAPKGEQNIEAFGLKVPSGDITRWGTVLLLVIQFYFWLHLHELKSRIDPLSPGWDVAWLGVYRRKSAIFAMLVSACFLPVVSVLVLVRRIPADRFDSRFGWILWPSAVCAALLSLAIASATGERLYRLRQFRLAAETPLDEPEVSEFGE